MARIENFVYCLGVNKNNGNTDILGILSTMQPAYVPGLYSFHVNFSIKNLTDGEHIFSLQFKDTKGILVAEIKNGKLMYKYNQELETSLPREYSGLNVTANMQNVNLKENGLYTMTLILDNKEMGQFDIFVHGLNTEK